MPTPQTINNDVLIRGNLEVSGGFVNLRRTDLVQETLASRILPIEDWRIWNVYQTLLGTAASDDLGITAGAFGTATPYVTAGQINADASAARYARFLVQIPNEYVAGQTIQISFFAGLFSGTVDGTVTIDLEAYKAGAATGALVSGADLCATATQDINSLTFADKAFVITDGSLNPGDWLDCRVAILFSNNATDRIPAISFAELLVDSKG